MTDSQPTTIADAEEHFRAHQEKAAAAAALISIARSLERIADALDHTGEER